MSKAFPYDSDDDSCIQSRKSPSYPTKFPQLCQALRRNDPLVTAVCTLSFDNSGTNPMMPFKTGVVELGKALCKGPNSMVSKIRLHLPYLLTKEDMLKGTTQGAASLLHWLQHCPSLRNVTFKMALGRQHAPVVILLLEQILRALVENPNVREFTSHLEDHHLPLLPLYLTSPNAHRLESLHLSLSHEGRGFKADAVAQAIEALPVLRTFKLSLDSRTSKLILGAVQSIRLQAVLKFKLVLRNTSGPTDASVTALLGRLLRNATNLKQVELVAVYAPFDALEVWGHILTALQSNRSIEHLKLLSCTLSPPSAARMLADVQHGRNAIRTLQLVGTRFPTSVLDLANMVYGSSQLEHIALDSQVFLWSQESVAEFFSTLALHASCVRLRSMDLRLRVPDGPIPTDRNDPTHVHPTRPLAPFLAAAVHLQYLTVRVSPPAHQWRACLRNLVPPPAFLASLRSNASLRVVRVFHEYEKYIVLKDCHVRWVDAVMTRNCKLPTLLCRSWSRGRNGGQVLFPTLCAAAQQAQRMAPNMLLLALVSSQQV